MITSQVEIACRIGDVFGASGVTKQHLVAIAAARGVPAGVLAQLQRLPDGTYRELRSLWPHLPELPYGA